MIEEKKEDPLGSQSNGKGTTWTAKLFDGLLSPTSCQTDGPHLKNGPVREEFVRVQSKLLRNGATATRSNSSNLRLLDSLFELEEESASTLPKRWLDYFCIVGINRQQKRQLLLDTATSTTTKGSSNATTNPPLVPQLLDSYPSHPRHDMDIPLHLPTFCFPNRYEPVLVQRPRQHSARKPKLPDPELCTIILTLASGHRLYGTLLTLYDRVDAQEVLKNDDEDETNSSTGVRVHVQDEVDERSDNDSNNTNEIECRLKDEDEDVYDWMVPKCWVLLSHYPFFHAHATLLKELLYTMNSGTSPVPWERYVAHMVDDIPLPIPGSSIVEWKSWLCVNHSHTVMRIARPAPNQLPMSSASFEPLFRTLSLSNILVVWAALLREDQVVLCTQPERVALLTPICEALLALLFPLEWQGIYIPVLPSQTNQTMDILEAPIPYLVGITMSPEAKQKKIYRQPAGVLWCDLDEDILHLGWDHQGRVQTSLPALPEAASMRLKDDLEKIADPLFLPPRSGCKGRMTVGRSGFFLENLARHPYAQMTRVHDADARPSPRPYILSQAAKVPPRGKSLAATDYWLHQENICSSSNDKTPSSKQNSVVDAKRRESMAVEASVGEKFDQDSSLLDSLLRQGRSIQAHTDRLMSVFGQDFATPSAYTAQGEELYQNILQNQDAIASQFFVEDDNTMSETVRWSFLRFFLSTLSDYSRYIDKETQRLNVGEFVGSLKMAPRNQDYVRSVVESQMFELFLQRDSYQRRLFDEMIIKQQQQHNKVLLASNSTPFLDSTKWKTRTILTPPFPCDLGVPLDYAYSAKTTSHFPDYFDPKQCVTGATYRDRSASSWQNTFCGVLNCMNCTG